MEWGRQMAYVNHFYFYLWDPERGGAFWKTNAYAPFPVWIWLNGHESAKRQLDKAGVAYRALDNGFRACDDPAALQRICDRLGTGAVRQFLWRWQQRRQRCVVLAPRHADAATSLLDQIAKTSSPNAISTRRVAGCSTPSS
jgi:hypothetical protein